jgi:zinc protease
VRSITVADVKRFYLKHYTPWRLVIGLAGGCDAVLLQNLRHDLVALPAGLRPVSPTVEPAPIVGRHVTIVEKDCNATAISMGFPISVLRGSKDWYALALANCWLGQHRNQNGHLYQVIREARGLNYGDYSYIEHFPSAGGSFVPPTNVCRRQQIFEIWIRPVPNANRHFALRAALRELQKFVDNGLTEDEFHETQKFLRKFVLHLAPTTMDRLGYALDDRFYGVKGAHLENFRRAMDEVTRAEVNAAIKKYLQYDNIDNAIVTKDAESLKKALVDEAPSPITYAMPKPEAVLAEDREISVFPLHIKAENVRIVPVAELFEK